MPSTVLHSWGAKVSTADKDPYPRGVFLLPREKGNKNDHNKCVHYIVCKKVGTSYGRKNKREAGEAGGGFEFGSNGGPQ